MMTRSKAMPCGFFAGVVAGIAMTFAMLLLAWAFDVATPLVILGDRLSVFISPKPFFWIMGRVGGYNHLKQLGVGSSMFGQILVGARFCLARSAFYSRVEAPLSRASFFKSRLSAMMAPNIKAKGSSQSPRTISSTV